MQASFNHFMNYDSKNKANPKIITHFFKALNSGNIELYFKYRHNQLEVDLLTKQEMKNLIEIVQPDVANDIRDLKGSAQMCGVCLGNTHAQYSLVGIPQKKDIKGRQYDYNVY